MNWDVVQRCLNWMIVPSHTEQLQGSIGIWAEESQLPTHTAVENSVSIHKDMFVAVCQQCVAEDRHWTVKELPEHIGISASPVHQILWQDSNICTIVAKLVPQLSNIVQKYMCYTGRSWYRASLMYSFKYNQQDALYNILHCCQHYTCFRRFFCPSSGAQTVHTATGICQACLLLPLAWVS
jgi:hypothetical protein